MKLADGGNSSAAPDLRLPTLSTSDSDAVDMHLVNEAYVTADVVRQSARAPQREPMTLLRPRPPE